MYTLGLSEATDFCILKVKFRGQNYTKDYTVGSAFLDVFTISFYKDLYRYLFLKHPVQKTGPYRESSGLFERLR